MQPHTTDPLSAAFAALADPTRRAILARLAEGETSVGELVKPFPISAPAISRHLRVLEQARLIERKVDAQWRICKLHPPGLQMADDWLSRYRAYWENSLDRLVGVLENGDTPWRPPAARRSQARLTGATQRADAPNRTGADRTRNPSSARKRKSP